MRGFSRLMLAILVVCLAFGGGTLWARGGRGRGGGGFKNTGGSSFRGNGNGHRGVAVGRSHGAGTAHRSPGAVGDQPWSKHRARELRKLEHRKMVADHLRQVGNHNERLDQVAAEMERRAQTHYDKQLEQIKQKYGIEDFDDAAAQTPHALAGETNNLLDSEVLEDSGDVRDVVRDTPVEAARRLTGTENALFRQIRNEQRTLAQRMQVVDQMRELAAQIGDNGMLQSAGRLEEWAMNHFDQRVMQITGFQQRGDVPVVSLPSP